MDRESASTALVKWEEWSDDTAQEDKSYNDYPSEFWKPKAKNMIRILPLPGAQAAKLKSNSPFVKTFQHFIQLVKDDNDTIAKFNCPKRMAKKRCPACEQADQLKEQGKEKKAKMFFPKLNAYCGIIDRNGDQGAVQVYRFGAMVYDLLMKERDEVGNFTSIREGFDISLKKSGEGLDTEYTVRAANDATPALEDAKALNELAENFPDLTKYGVIPSYEDCVKALKAAAAAARGEKDDDDDRPRRGSPKRRRDDDEDEDDRPRTKKKAADAGWDDDGDEDAIDTHGETVGDDPEDTFN